jgi:c-di-GMP-binding flagellar brake protein YcgR
MTLTSTSESPAEADGLHRTTKAPDGEAVAGLLARTKSFDGNGSHVDRRATARTEAFVPAEVQFPVEKGRWIDALTFDISPAGVGLVAERQLAVGSVVGFRCELQAHRRRIPVSLTATIMWRADVADEDTVLSRRTFRYGLEFLGVPARLEEQLLAAVFYLETSRRARR